jgi:ATP-dependent DNA helicase DinG
VPLTDDTKAAIRTGLSNIKEGLPGFRDRPSQRRMIAEIAKTLAGEHGDRRLIACEAGTGTGKSLGYLLAAIPVAKAERRRIVLSTATVALQEQLANRDLPALARLSGYKFDYTLAKGRRRYACTLKLARLSGEEERQASMFEAPAAAWTRPPEAQEVATVAEMFQAQQGKRWNGDLDAWPDQVPPALLDLVTTDRHGCLGGNCSYIDGCPFFKAREDLRTQDVVVANHDLVLADLAMGGGAILPPPDETIYIFDEAHHLPDKAVQHFSAQVRLRGAQEWLGRIGKSVQDLLLILPDNPRYRRLADEIDKGAGRCIELIEQVHEAVLTGWPQEAENDRLRFRNGELPAPLREAAALLTAPARQLKDGLTSLRKALDKEIEETSVTPARVEKLIPELGAVLGRAENFADLWQMFARVDPPEQPPTARWIELTRGGEADFLLAASLVSPGGLLASLLWDVCAGAVLTSATLTALGRFDRFRLAAGLRDDDGSQYLQLPSPFDYATNAELHLPWMRADPRTPNEHTDEVVRLLKELVVAEEGTLVLFASNWQMQDVYARLPLFYKEPILMQGELPKAEILRRHAERIEGGQGSVIFGLASFTEGVDLPGKLCSHVIIAKIPFAVPDSPVEATLADWLESRGRNPFLEITVPDASLKLIQACGRLIRSESDSGRVTVLDRRLLTKPYGRQLLNALPPFRRRIEKGPQK